MTQQTFRRRTAMASQRSSIPYHGKFNLFIYSYVILSMMVLVAGDDTASENCAMDIWIFSSFDSCQSSNAPVANGKIYADGQCHTIETDIDPSNPSYSLFPGNYRAQCIDSNTIRFSDSACFDNVCTSTTLVTDTPPVCDRDNASPASLYSRLVPPEYTVQDATNANVGAFYTCLKLDGSDVTVTFVVFGDCSQPSCVIAPPPSTNAPVAVAPQVAPTTLAPITLPPATTPPVTTTAAPVTVIAPTTAPFPLNATAAPVTVNITSAPLPPPTSAPLTVVAPIVVPTVQPASLPIAEPTAPTPTAPVTNGLVNDIISVAIRLSPMNVTIDTTTNSIRNWEDVTIEQVESNVNENEFAGTTIFAVDISNISQKVIDPKNTSSGTTSRRNYRSLQENTTTIVTGPTKTTALEIYFDLSMSYTPPATLANSVSLADFLTSSFDSEQERSNYLIKLVTNDDIFRYVRLVEIIHVNDRDGQPITPAAPATSPMAAPTPTTEQTSNSTESGGINGLLIALAGGGTALIACAILGTLYYQRQQGKNGKSGRNSSSNNSKENKTNDVNETPSDNDEYYGEIGGPAHLMNNNVQFSPPQQRWTNEIVVDPSADDVSTLGGSVLAGYLDPTTINNDHNNQNTEEDEPTASVNLDYDYNRNQYRSDATEDVRSRTIHTETTGTAFTNFTTKLGMNGEAAVFSDDVSFEELYADVEDDDIIQNSDKSMKNHTPNMEKIASLVKPFEVRAPPGKLGMVVDTPNGGVPVVRAIRPDSVLNDRVLVGDRLISVDHKDVTNMTALDVSSLISLKQHQHRLLVFCRLQQPITPITTAATTTPQTSYSAQPSPIKTMMATSS